MTIVEFPNTKTVVEFFEPYNIEHLKAFEYLLDTGVWPKDFYEENLEGLEFPNNWQIILLSEMANCWVTGCLDGNVDNNILN